MSCVLAALPVRPSHTASARLGCTAILDRYVAICSWSMQDCCQVRDALQTGTGYVDVSTRLVDFPSDAGTLAGIWYSIAQQLVVNQTLLPSLQALLGAFSAPLVTPVLPTCKGM